MTSCTSVCNMSRVRCSPSCVIQSDHCSSHEPSTAQREDVVRGVVEKDPYMGRSSWIEQGSVPRGHTTDRLATGSLTRPLTRAPGRTRRRVAPDPEPPKWGWWAQPSGSPAQERPEMREVMVEPRDPKRISSPRDSTKRGVRHRQPPPTRHDTPSAAGRPRKRWRRHCRACTRR